MMAKTKSGPQFANDIFKYIFLIVNIHALF